MVQVNKTDITYKGVALSDLTIDDLRSFECETTSDLIIQSNALEFAEKQELKTIANWCKNYVESFTQTLDLIQAEIRVRYSGMQV